MGSFWVGCASHLILSRLSFFARYPRRARCAMELGVHSCIPRFSSRGGSPSVRASSQTSSSRYALTGVPLPRASDIPVALWGLLPSPPRAIPVLLYSSTGILKALHGWVTTWRKIPAANSNRSGRSQLSALYWDRYGRLPAITSF